MSQKLHTTVIILSLKGGMLNGTKRAKQLARHAQKVTTMVERIADEKTKEWVDAIAFSLSANANVNPPRKSYKNYTSSDLMSLDTATLSTMRNLFTDEKYTYTDKLLPDGMNRAEYTRAILRELARRGEVADKYIGFPTNNPAIQTKSISVVRTAPGVAGAKPEMVTEQINTLVIHDAAVDMILQSPEGLRLSADVVKAIGLDGGRLYPLKNDAEAYDFGYAVGSMPRFRQNDALKIGLKIDPTPAQVELIRSAVDRMTKGKTDAEVEAMRSEVQQVVTTMSNQFNQNNYCTSTDLLFKEGRAHDNRTAMLLGMAQARIDARSDFKPTSDHIGLFGDCPNKKVQQR